jgi:integrase
VTAQLAAVPDPDTAPGDELAVLRGVLRPDFLARAGWDSKTRTLTPVRGDPLLSLKECAVADCAASTVHKSADLCATCRKRWKASALAWDDFLARPCGGRPHGDRACRVADCPRPGKSAERLCATHVWQRQRHYGLPVEQWLALPEVGPLPSFGTCIAASCAAVAAHRCGLCAAHRTAWCRHLRDHGGAVLAEWARHAAPADVAGHEITLHGLPDRVVAELLAGLQRRTDAGLRTPPTCTRYPVKMLHAQRADSVLDLAQVPATAIRSDARQLLRSLAAELYCLLSGPEKERARDIWQLQVFGLAGKLDFTGITQRWLRESVKWWAAEDLPLRRGSAPADSARDTIRAAMALSQSLRLARDDGGHDPAALGREDIVAFSNRLAHQLRTGELTADSRLRLTRRIFRLLNDMHAKGITAPGGAAAGLPAAFVLRRSDIPTDPDRQPRPRSLPDAVLKLIAENLDVLEERCGISERRITEILIDTGRRPDEVCTLEWDCLERDPSGDPVLIYTDAKNNRPGRRLPIAEATAAVITAQKDWARCRYPHTPPGDLALFPRDKGNKDGTKPIRADSYGNAHRVFADEIAHLLLDADGQQVNPALVVPYAYRHSYAQRHADAGVQPDVLRELMSHRSMRTTTGYYRISENRLRAAVDKVARHQFNAAGQRVFTSIAGLLSDEHARMRVGQVAVPFGTCTEPSNVKAGGHACPYKYTCTGCGHFRSDPSYLPELKSYLQQLLADRERLHAATDLQPWAHTQATPPDEQVSQVRELIRRIEADMENLSDTDRAQIQQAVTAIRAARQTVVLGMPAIRPAAGNR